MYILCYILSCIDHLQIMLHLSIVAQYLLHIHKMKAIYIYVYMYRRVDGRHTHVWTVQVMKLRLCSGNVQ